MDVHDLHDDATKCILSNLFHPVNDLSKSWAKSLSKIPNGKYIVSGYLKDIYLDNWDKEFWLIEDPVGCPLGFKQLLLTPSIYSATKHAIEISAKTTLPDITGADYSQKSKAQAKLITFQSQDQVQIFLDETVYLPNRIIRHKIVKEEGFAVVKKIKDQSNTFKFKKILALDFETWEQSKPGDRKILEVGITTCCIQPVSAVATRHIIFKENLEFRNGKYCKDNRENFGFGTSETVGESDVTQILRDALEEVDFAVFHNCGAEIGTLKKLSIKLGIPCYDTQTISQIIPHKPDGNLPGLETLLTLLELPTSHMHNAGNDSHLTMMAFLSMMEKYGDDILNAK